MEIVPDVRGLVVAVILSGTVLACSGASGISTQDGSVPAQLVYDVGRCNGVVGMDPFETTSAEIRGDELQVALRHSGSCRPHVFRLCWDGSFKDLDPVVANVKIAHDSQGDPCEDSVSGDFRFGLIPMKRQFQNTYATQAGTINILGMGIAGFYTFTQ